ncbi:MAG: SCO family protein [Woeseiaceae bacterium]|jgi:protein SCO1/2|nr:SCO family protein [Woeseiaceae bacterium]
MRTKNFIIAIVLGGALAAGIFVAASINKPAELQTAFVVPSPAELPAFALQDQYGEPVTADTFRGQWDLVFFGFTNCPDICPTTLQILANAKLELQNIGAGAIPRVVFISVDPERDTPEILGRYVDYFGAANLGVTGTLPELVKLTTALGIFFEKAPTDDGNYGVDHSAAVLVINPEGQFSALFSAPHTIANYVHDLPIIMDVN